MRHQGTRSPEPHAGATADAQRHPRAADAAGHSRRGAEYPPGFFAARRPFDFEASGTSGAGGLFHYPNVPGTIGLAVASGHASLGDLKTKLTLPDLYDILEIAQVDSHNRKVLDDRRRAENAKNRR
jgi:hypothetical protein